MDIRELQHHWDKLGKDDPLWAILTRPDKKGGRWTIEEFFQLGKNEINGVMDYLRGLGIEGQFERAMDFGCGVGRLTQALGDHYDQVVGIDIAESMVQQARRLNHHGGRCRYLVNSGTNLSLIGDERYDLIYTNMVLQHMPTDFSARYIGEFIRVLKPRGIALFQIPAEPSGTLIGRLLRLLPVSLVRTIRKMDMYGTPRQRVIDLLHNAGAEVIDIQPDTNAGPHWIGYRYCARRKA